MKKGFLLILLTIAALAANAQTCKRDSAVLSYGDTVLALPRPYSPSYPNRDLKPACIGEPYNQSVTLKVPAALTLPGFPPVALDSVTIATSGAVKNLPTGLNYTCDPPNCHFQKGTLGCILMAGTPAASNPIGEVDLEITLKVYNALLFPTGFELTFPGTAAPGSHYYLDVRAAGNCTSGSDELPGKIGSILNAPNPFSGETVITVQSLVNEDFTFEVFDLLGQRVHSQNVRLNEGENQISFNANGLPAGTYFYALRNQTGKVSKTFVKL